MFLVQNIANHLSIQTQPVNLSFMHYFLSNYRFHKNIKNCAKLPRRVKHPQFTVPIKRVIAIGNGLTLKDTVIQKYISDIESSNIINVQGVQGN